MSNLFREIVNTTPVSKRLQFGYNENVKIESIDYNVRKAKGMPLNTNTYIRLSQVDEENQIIATTELNFWNLDPTKGTAEDDFINEFTIMCGLIDAIGKSIEEFDDAVMSELEESFSGKELSEIVTTKKGCESAIKTLQKHFKAFTEEFVGIDKSPLFKCKLVVNKNGFLQFPREIDWILPMDSTIDLPSITKYEQRIRQESLSSDSTRKAKAEKPGTPPSLNGGRGKVTKPKKEAKVAPNSLNNL